MPKEETLNTDTDRYPTLVAGLRRFMRDGEFEDTAFELLEVRATAAGELTWRIREPRADELAIGYLPPQ